MAAATDLTFDLVPPRRPSLDDMGGATLVDHAAFPPDKQTMPYADQLNQLQKQMTQAANLQPVAEFSVAFSGGTPGITQFVTAPTGPVLATFTVNDGGAGITTISWPANTFPTSRLKPMVSLNEDVAALAPIALYPTATSVQVKTRNSAGTLTDIAFTVSVF